MEANSCFSVSFSLCVGRSSTVFTDESTATHTIIPNTGVWWRSPVTKSAQMSTGSQPEDLESVI